MSKAHRIIPELAKDLSVEYEQIGSLVIAFDQADLKTLKELYERGIQNGVKWNSSKKNGCTGWKPNLSNSAIEALWRPRPELSRRGICALRSPRPP